MIIEIILSLYCLKTTETLLGIETPSLMAVGCGAIGLKTTETLLGIETGYREIIRLPIQVSKLLKPF